jgi:putative phosphoesterase
MKVGVISDTHDRLPTFTRAIELFKQQGVDAILHAGDYVAPFAAKIIAPSSLSIPLYCIYGNNDGERKGLKAVLPGLVDGPLSIELGGRSIVMHHFIDWMEAADYADAEVVISGHNHQVSSEKRDGKLFLNPGECCGWLTDRCTVALLELDSLQVEIVDIPSS